MWTSHIPVGPSWLYRTGFSYDHVGDVGDDENDGDDDAYDADGDDDGNEKPSKTARASMGSLYHP